MLRELKNTALMRDWRKPTGRAEWSVGILGGVIALIGIILALGGAELIAAGGSWYYLFAGLALIVAGLAIAQRKLLGAWIYVGAFLMTALWAFWEVGLNGWALVPRLVGPLVLLLLVIFSLPVLDANRGRRRSLLALGGFALIVIVLGVVVAQANRPDAPGAMPEPFAQAIADASLIQVGADWPAYGGTYNAQRYSPLDQINRENVRRLERAWTFRTGDMPKERWGAETTPLKVGDTLYLCTGRSTLIAIDAATGAERWRHDPEVPDASIPYTAACRGVAYYAAQHRSRRRMRDAHHCGHARRATDCRRCAHRNAVCGFRQERRRRYHNGMGETGLGMVSITSAPTIVRGVVITGHQVLDGQRANAPSGVVQGFDAITGALRWAWDMEHPERTGLPPEGETYARGTPNMWTTATGDEALGLVYLPLGNAAADYWSSHRSQAENQHSAALVALNVETGREVWRFQTVHMGVWDYDLGSQPTLIDFPTETGVVPAVILPSKQGEIYILDRRTGLPLHGVEERPVPGGGLEPELRSPTQPFSRYHSLRMPDLRERDMWGMSLIDQMFCRIQFRQATYHGIYTPPTTETRWIQYPSYNGGSDWGGIAVDPRRGVIIANYSDLPNYNRLVPRDEATRRGWAPRDQARGGDMSSGAEGAGDPQMGVPFAIDVNAGWRMPSTGLLCKQPPYGGIRAIDLRTGRTIWDRPLGTARRNGPWGIPSMLSIDIGTPNNGGAVVTAGGLVFIAAATDNLIRAIDVETGATLWQDLLPAGGRANPMVYEIGGRQYLVIMAGGHHFMGTPPGDYVIAYTLPQR